MRCFAAYRRLVSVAQLLLLLSAGGPVWARPHAKRVARDQVTDVESEWVKVQVQGDVAGMDKLLAPDFLGITGFGEVVTKTQQLDRMRDRTFIIHTMEISDVRVKLLGQHAAIVTSLAQVDATSEGHPLVGSFRYTHVYQKLPNGTWTITNFEATRVPESRRHGMPNSGELVTPEATGPQA